MVKIISGHPKLYTEKEYNLQKKKNISEKQIPTENKNYTQKRRITYGKEKKIK